jgi:hypothetical protein
MARIAAALSLVLAFLAAGSMFRSTEFHNYTVTIVKDGNGVLQAEKDPYEGKFEIDYGYGTNWNFINATAETVVVQIVENHSGTCHVRFSPAGSVFCESQTITLAPKASDQLGATAEDMSFYEYWPFASYTGDLRVGKRGEVLVPKDPDLEIERDYLAFKIVLVVSSLLLAAVFWRTSRRGRPA